MAFVAHETYPASPRIELPSQTSSNAWVNTLLWVRKNTPQDAVFAVDSRYFKDAGTDVHGFRAVSERSALADYFKDGGVVSMFPDLADEWKQMSDATYGLNHFQYRISKDSRPNIGPFPGQWSTERPRRHELPLPAAWLRSLSDSVAAGCRSRLCVIEPFPREWIRHSLEQFQEPHRGNGYSQIGPTGSD